MLDYDDQEFIIRLCIRTMNYILIQRVVIRLDTFEWVVRSISAGSSVRKRQIQDIQGSMIYTRYGLIIIIGKRLVYVLCEWQILVLLSIFLNCWNRTINIDVGSKIYHYSTIVSSQGMELGCVYRWHIYLHLKNGFLNQKAENDGLILCMCVCVFWSVDTTIWTHSLRSFCLYSVYYCISQVNIEGQRVMSCVFWIYTTMDMQQSYITICCINIWTNGLQDIFESPTFNVSHRVWSLWNVRTYRSRIYLVRGNPEHDYM